MAKAYAHDLKAIKQTKPCEVKILCTKTTKYEGKK